MVDFNHNGNGKPKNDGGQGGPLQNLEPEAGQTSDTRLIERAIRERWPIQPQHRQDVVDRLTRIVKNELASDREATSAARALIAADGQNQADEHKYIDKRVPDLHSVVEPQRETVAQLLDQQDYIEFLRERERHSEPGPICTNGHQGNGKPLANGDARNGHRP